VRADVLWRVCNVELDGSEERRRRREEQKARREADKREENEAEERRAAEQRDRRETSARLIVEYDKQRTQLVDEAVSIVGRLSSTDWAADADPLCAHVFAQALRLVRSKLEPLMAKVIEVVTKHRTTSTQPDFKVEEVFVLELRAAGAGEAAGGTAIHTLINFPIDTAEIAKLEPAVRARAAEGFLTETDMQVLRTAVFTAAAELAPTVIHEFTHMALYKAYQYESYPWLQNKYSRNLKQLAQDLHEPQQAARLPELLKLLNPDWERSALSQEIAELEDFAEADAVPPQVKLVCQRLRKYSKPGTELASHLMEIVYLQGEDYVRKNLPKGYQVLVRLQQQFETHLKAGPNTDWFAAHGLPAAGFEDN
jgi:hypothetical protein